MRNLKVKVKVVNLGDIIVLVALPKSTKEKIILFFLLTVYKLAFWGHLNVRVKVVDLGDIIILFTLPKSTKKNNNVIFLTNHIETSVLGSFEGQGEGQ